ncbi:hypothetical protein N7490_004118 [Penicillium lividum]|nr:hypothetical protein N7490_004118 [Penicillium lividum]
MSLNGQTVLLTGASMGIGAAIAQSLATCGTNLISSSFLDQRHDKLANLRDELTKQHPASRIIYRAVDVGDYECVDSAIQSCIAEIGHIDILINKAGLAIGAPNPFHAQGIAEIQTMISTNINGPMNVTHSVLNRSMYARKAGTIMNITSVTGLEVPPFAGEVVYHSSKAAQEAFTNALRNELAGTNIKVLALRPGVVATNFHSLRVGHDKGMYDSFVEGYEPLVSEDVAQAAIYMLSQPVNVSIKALDVVPSAQRSINVFDRSWNERQGR